jgi:AbrB family looped-hinge helix DNA binding protein
MELIELAKMTSKGQVTIPAVVRDLLKLEKGSNVLFKMTENGVLLSPCEVREKPPYTAREWKKIEQLVAEKGKGYSDARSARKHIEAL